MSQLLKKLITLAMCLWHIPSMLLSKGDVTEPLSCFIAPAKPNKHRKKYKQSYKTLDAWYNAVHAFEQFPEDYVKRSPLTLDELLKTVESAAQATEKFHNKTIWLDNIKLPKKLYSLKKDIFAPYVQKIVIDDTAEIALFGDVHGSVHSILKDLKQLQKLGWFKDSFKITKPNAYIFFLGDEIDRGKWGAEVLYTIARLKEANPSKVFNIRGNHERLKCKYSYADRKKDAKQNFEFIHELQKKFPEAEKEEIERIFNTFNSFPMAIFVGAGNKGHTDFLQISHGAVDLGFDPTELFQGNASLQRITTFRRGTNLKRLSTKSQKIVTDTLIKNHPEELSDFQPKTLQDPSRVGLMWNDFIFTGEPFTFDKAGSWNFGRDLFEEILNFGTNTKHTLHGIIRGHEHNYNTYPGLWDTHGALPSWDNKVITLFSGPANFLPNGNKKLIFNYDSFCILTIKKQYKDWRLTHWWREFKTSRKPKSRTSKWQSEKVPLPNQIQQPKLLRNTALEKNNAQEPVTSIQPILCKTTSNPAPNTK